MLALASTSFFAYDAAFYAQTLNISTGFTAVFFFIGEMRLKDGTECGEVCGRAEVAHFLETTLHRTSVKLKCANQP